GSIASCTDSGNTADATPEASPDTISADTGLESSASCPALDQRPKVDVPETIATSTTWTCDKRWVLKTVTWVSPTVVLTIQPGTVVLGDKGSALVIERGARLDAVG